MFKRRTLKASTSEDRPKRPRNIQQDETPPKTRLIRSDYFVSIEPQIRNDNYPSIHKKIRDTVNSNWASICSNLKSEQTEVNREDSAQNNDSFVQLPATMDYHNLDKLSLQEKRDILERLKEQKKDLLTENTRIRTHIANELEIPENEL